MAAPASTNTPAPSSPSPSTMKVFVGNLSFKTRDADLQNAFSAVTKVTGAKVIVDPRGLSMGYGFVEVSTVEDAKKAIDQMNKKEIDGRQVNVELANARDPNAPRPPRSNFSRGRGRGGFRGGRGGRGGFRGGRGGFRGGRGGRGGGGRGGFRNSNEPRVESKTTLFVSNLPFDMDDNGFSKLFSEKGIKPLKLNLVKRQDGSSKGFGFAEFESEDHQSKALKALSGQSADGRPINIRVAFHDDRSPIPTQQQTTSNQTTQPQPQQQQSAPKQSTASSGKQEATPAPATTQQPTAQQTPPASQKTESKPQQPAASSPVPQQSTKQPEKPQQTAATTTTTTPQASSPSQKKGGKK